MSISVSGKLRKSFSSAPPPRFVHQKRYSNIPRHSSRAANSTPAAGEGEHQTHAEFWCAAFPQSPSSWYHSHQCHQKATTAGREPVPQHGQLRVVWEGCDLPAACARRFVPLPFFLLIVNQEGPISPQKTHSLGSGTKEYLCAG